MSNLVSRINTLIKWSFYAIFFLVPLAMWPDTYELFEFNKMWLVFGFSIFIFFLWGTKMLFQGKFEVRRTPLDIPIGLFLISQVISTILSTDPHVSLWGYYSRFNGGLFSTLAYIFLYFAFITNLTVRSSEEEDNRQPISYKILFVSLLSGAVVTLWGLPSHWGYDLTCLVFRGTLDTTCWTEAFQPQVRMFSTLGQPNWMGTFLAALVPISLGFALFKYKEDQSYRKQSYLYLTLTAIFFLSILFTLSQSSFLGIGLGMIVFLALVVVRAARSREKLIRAHPIRITLVMCVIFALMVAFNGSPIESLNKYTTFKGLKNLVAKPQNAPSPSKNVQANQGLEGTANIQIGGSQSGDIRLIVWKGAIELFKRNPLFGTGVETYAYAYYNVKPLAHNLTSEWDYLYNKAHNEYLNYLATTGIAGLGTYLAIIIFFFYYSIKILISKTFKFESISIGILSGYSAILVSNFFGFSVVPVNLLFFLLPALFFELSNPKTLSRSFSIPKKEEVRLMPIRTGRMIALVLLGIIVIYLEYYLLNFWFADRNYALGYNLNKAGEIVQANAYLDRASQMLPGEDLYRDELAINKATLALAFAQNNQATEAATFARDALELSDQNIKKHPNNIIFYKTRVRVTYALAQINLSYIDAAIDVANTARRLAPTDVKLAYNLALLYNIKGENDKMIELIDETIRLKPNYVDAYYAKGLLYSELAKSDPSKASVYKQQAREALEYVLKNLDPTHKASADLLQTL